MENKIKKAEFSRVNKIGETEWEHTITRDDFYTSDGELHLNALAWESPSIYTDVEGEEHYGFVPGDNFYDEIIETFKTFPDVYREKFNGGAIIRKHWVGSAGYDIIITWYSEVKMVSFYFQKFYEYSI